MSARGEGGSSSGYPDVKPLTDALLTETRAALGDRLTAVALYGSVARGEAHRWSDIDLFVVHRGDRETVSEAFLRAELRLRDQPLARELSARGVPTAPVAIYRSEEELADTPWLMLDMTDHGIVCSIRVACSAGSWSACGRGSRSSAHAASSWRMVRGTGTSSRICGPARSSPCRTAA